MSILPNWMEPPASRRNRQRPPVFANPEKQAAGAVTSNNVLFLHLGERRTTCDASTESQPHKRLFLATPDVPVVSTNTHPLFSFQCYRRLPGMLCPDLSSRSYENFQSHGGDHDVGRLQKGRVAAMTATTTPHPRLSPHDFIYFRTPSWK